MSGGPSISDFIGGNISTSPARGMSKSERACERLLTLGDETAEREGARVLACIERRVRCHSRWCPRCQRRDGIRQQRMIEQAMRATPEPEPLSILTMTIGCDDVEKGLEVLGESLRRLRRSKCSRDLRQGLGRISIIESRGSATWNVHVHCVAWGTADVDGMRRKHEDLAGSACFGGSVDLRPLDRRWADAARTFRPRRLLRLAPLVGRLDRLERRAARGARLRAAWAADGDLLGLPTKDFFRWESGKLARAGRKDSNTITREPT
jgi:hypothetical protein